MKCSLGISNFLEEISSLSHSIVFLYFFALIPEEGVLISPCYSLEPCIQMGMSFLFSFTFRFTGFPGGLEVKASSWNVGDLGLIPGLGRSSGGRHSKPLQYSCLQNPHGKEMQKSKMAVWGGLTNSCEKKRGEKQRRKGKI